MQTGPGDSEPASLRTLGLGPAVCPTRPRPRDSRPLGAPRPALPLEPRPAQPSTSEPPPLGAQTCPHPNPAPQTPRLPQHQTPQPPGLPLHRSPALQPQTPPDSPSIPALPLKPRPSQPQDPQPQSPQSQTSPPPQPCSPTPSPAHPTPESLLHPRPRAWLSTPPFLPPPPPSLCSPPSILIPLAGAQVGADKDEVPEAMAEAGMEPGEPNSCHPSPRRWKGS